MSKDSIWRIISKILQNFLETKQGPERTKASAGNVHWAAMHAAVSLDWSSFSVHPHSTYISTHRETVREFISYISHRIVSYSGVTTRRQPSFLFFFHACMVAAPPILLVAQSCSSPAQQSFLRAHAWRPCLVHPENQKVFKISRHIESYGICMKH